MATADYGVMFCWQCGKEMSVVRNQLGTDVECPHCRAIVTVAPQAFGAPPAARSMGATPVSATRKSPAAAAVLNFFLWGAGYIYAGRTWGWAILIPSIVLSLVWLGSMVEPMGSGEMVAGSLVSLALGWHAYHMVREAQSGRG